MPRNQQPLGPDPNNLFGPSSSAQDGLSGCAVSIGVRVCAGVGQRERRAGTDYRDALLTRRAKAKSTRHAVIVRFSRTRDRDESTTASVVELEALADAWREADR